MVQKESGGMEWNHVWGMHLTVCSPSLRICSICSWISPLLPGLLLPKNCCCWCISELEPLKAALKMEARVGGASARRAAEKATEFSELLRFGGDGRHGAGAAWCCWQWSRLCWWYSEREAAMDAGGVPTSEGGVWQLEKPFRTCFVICQLEIKNAWLHIIQRVQIKNNGTAILSPPDLSAKLAYIALRKPPLQHFTTHPYWLFLVQFLRVRKVLEKLLPYFV